jgi:hypothetical protein
VKNEFVTPERLAERHGEIAEANARAAEKRAAKKPIKEQFVPRHAKLISDDKIFCTTNPGKRQRLVCGDTIGASKRHDAA